MEGGGLKEEHAWPAQPQDAYGLEKLASEELCKHYGNDFGIETRIARFHNIYGPYGTWKGGARKGSGGLLPEGSRGHDGGGNVGRRSADA